MKRTSSIISFLLPYLADVGTVGFLAVFAIMVIGALAESSYPGLVFNQLSPQGLTVVMIFFGGLSLLSRGKGQRILRLSAFGALGAAAVAASAWRGWDYFVSLPADRIALTVACAGITALIFASAMRGGGR